MPTKVADYASGLSKKAGSDTAARSLFFQETTVRIDQMVLEGASTDEVIAMLSEQYASGGLDVAELQDLERLLASAQKKAGPLKAKLDRLSKFGPPMKAVAERFKPTFEGLGFPIDEQTLMAIALEEADATNPLGKVSFDGGLGLMQITPMNGKLDENVASALGWDNDASVPQNRENSSWRDPLANLTAAAETLKNKGSAIQNALPDLWQTMTPSQRLRAVLFAYNAGQGNAIAALKEGGPDAKMISRYKFKGEWFQNPYLDKVQHNRMFLEAEKWAP